VGAPSYPAFAAGFVLWGAQGALQSGAFEALLYEELDRIGAGESFARVYGRATAASTVAAAIATGIAAPVFAAGGFTALGIASVVACVAAAAVATTLPEHRSQGTAGEDAATAGKTPEPPGSAACSTRARAPCARIRASAGRSSWSPS
jgi:hypothetical protein